MCRGFKSTEGRNALEGNLRQPDDIQNRELRNPKKGGRDTRLIAFSYSA